MKQRIAIVMGMAPVAALAPAVPAMAQPGAAEDLARWVNPYVGTKPGGADHGTDGGAGNTFPGADVPFGMDSGARVDLSVTQRTGIGRFTFPAGGPATMLVNTSGSIAGADDAETAIGTNSISGWVTSGRFCGVDHRYRLYFHAQFDQSFASVGTWKNGSVTVSSRPPTGFRCPSPAPGAPCRVAGSRCWWPNRGACGPRSTTSASRRTTTWR